MFSFDQTFNAVLSGNVDTPFTSGAFYFASWLFNPLPFAVLLILSVWGIYKKYGKAQAMFLFSTPLVALAVSWIIKVSTDVARPLTGHIWAFGQSFPSAHTAVATAYFLALLHFLRHTRDTARRRIHIAFCVFCPLFVGVSRLYFGVHWLSDVLAGYVIGAVVVYCCVAFLNKCTSRT